MATPSFASASAEFVDEIIRQAELRLDAQLSAALAADQRAMTFAGLLFAGIAVLLGGDFGTFSREAAQPILVVTIGFTMAAGCACWSARPSPWHYVGNFPASWSDDISQGTSFDASRKETASDLQELLDHNESALQRAARWMRASMVTAVASAVAGIALILV
jgi:hypothetical protein